MGKDFNQVAERCTTNDNTVKYYKAVVAYDGTAYYGWQRQKQWLTVQAVIEDQLRRVTRHSQWTIEGSGRTDRGVHAMGQVFSFYGRLSVPVQRLAEILNHQLPPDIRIQSVEEAVPGFHARYDAIGKTYRYRIYRNRLGNPFQQRYSWQVYGILDLEQMQEGAAYLLGQHDFAAFMASGSLKENTVRRIDRIHIQEKEELDEVWLDFTGNGFLYNMVRIMTALLVEVGRGKRKPEAVKAILESRKRILCPLTAPAQGLCLMQVHYRA